MTDADAQARNRFFLMRGANLAASLGAVFGIVIAGRADETWQVVLGGALVLASLYVMAVVPRALARKWKTPEQP